MLLRLGRASQRAEAAGLTGEPNEQRIKSLTDSFRNAIIEGIEQGLSAGEIERLFMDAVRAAAINQIVTDMMTEWDVAGHIQRGEEFDWEGF